MENKTRFFSFSGQITLGDMCIALGLIVPFIIWAATIQDRVENDEARQSEDHQAIREMQVVESQLANNFMQFNQKTDDKFNQYDYRLNIKP